MHRSALCALAVGLGLVVVGCGSGGGNGNGKGSQTATGPNGGSGKGGGREGLQNGKFATRDGMTKMVIERDGPKAKIQIEGSNDIIELTAEEVRHQSELMGYSFRTPDNKPMLFVGVGGGILYIKGRDELPITRLSDAPKLGAATVAGAPKKEPVTKSASDKAVERLSSIAVVKKMSKYKATDAANLKLVAEAFEAADKSMWVHFVPGSSPSAKWQVVPDRTMYSSASKDKIDPKVGLGKYGSELFKFLEIDNKDQLAKWGLQVATPSGMTPAEGTPGLVWDVDSWKTIFVSADGGIYAIEHNTNGSDVEVGVDGSLSKWPAAPQHVVAGPGEVNGLVEVGAIEKTTADPIEKSQDAWRQCVEASFKGSLAKELKALDTENIQWSARTSRKKQAKEKWVEKVDKDCGTNKAKMETQLVTFIDTRTKERAALYERVKARATTLGLAK